MFSRRRQQSMASSAAPASPANAADDVVSGVAGLTIGLLYGPVVQFAQPAAGQAAASIVAMPAALPLSVCLLYTSPSPRDS